MATTTIHTSDPNARNRVRDLAAGLPAMLAGSRHASALSHGIKLRVAVAFLMHVKEAFIVKARGGTGDDGITWPPLTKEYLAYGRGPFSTREAGRSAPGKVKGGKRAGQQKDGFMSPAELKQWRQIFYKNFARLRITLPEKEAKSFAAAIAWARMKERGVRTKLDVFGNRKVDILRDRGILFNSLSPGDLSTRPDGAATYNHPPGQVVYDVAGGLLVGTNVDYARYHHYAKDPKRRRRLWPDELPASWLAHITRQVRSGIADAVAILAKGAA
jgi:hypothetical protein